MTRITTHVLDATTGTPAAHVAVLLARHVSEGTAPVAEGLTDADGRLAFEHEALGPGVHELTFRTGAWFAERGIRSFHPLVTIAFTLDEGSAHVHVPLLLSPFSYTTYRGS